MTAFKTQAEERAGRALPTYADLHAWSVNAPADFWRLVWDYCEVVAEHRGETVLEHADRMPGARWFPDAKLNFAENLLSRDGDETAIVFRNEVGVRRTVTREALRAAVARAAAGLRAAGVLPGDRVAGYLPNLPETLVAALASASLGAIWSSCSPDFGVAGVADRFGQITPRILVTADGYPYNGRSFDRLGDLPETLAALPSVEHCIVVPYSQSDGDVRARLGSIDAGGAKLSLWGDFVGLHADAALEFAQLQVGERRGCDRE